MKICGLIAEYNPFHLGHLKHIDYIKNVLHAQKIVVIMSGNFTQRGEIAVLDKFTRAKHAIIAGADVVIELPTVFATANAEVFARGAVNILDSIGIIDGLCFGVESGTEQEYITLAKAMNDESKEFKKILKSKLESGISLAKAKAEAVKESGVEFNEQLISSPNNILGLEYVKAILKAQSDIKIFPMKREGDHNDEQLKKGVTSATSIRNQLKIGKQKAVKKCVPPYVFSDLAGYPTEIDVLSVASVLLKSTEEISKVADCTEGLENRIKAFCKDNHNLEDIIEKVSTKRYPKSRIRRIITANLLGINKDLTDDALSNKTYAKILAVNSQSKDLIPLICQNSKIPVLTRKSDMANLKKTALKCFEKDVLASDIYSLITNKSLNEHQMIII